MNGGKQDRRREERFEIGGRAVLRSGSGGQRFEATVLNVSTGGLFLRLDTPYSFQVGDEVVCEARLASTPEQAFASWGLGRVLRVDPTGTAIELQAGTFESDH